MSEILELPVVPDSIEPYKGFKALNISRDGTLWSPSESIQWPAKHRLEAVCTRGLSQWSWVPVEGKPREMDATKTVPAGRLVAVTSVVSSSSSMPTQAPVNVKPSNPLPPGWSWSWEPLTHEAPAQGCTCGIYAVSQPSDCLSYVKPEGVIAEVALWGNVVPGSNGVRAQYAYPKSLLAPYEIVDELKLTAELYGIPIVVLDPPEPEPMSELAQTAAEEWSTGVVDEPIDVTSMGDPVKKTLPAAPKKGDPVFEMFAASIKKMMGDP